MVKIDITIDMYKWLKQQWVKKARNKNNQKQNCKINLARIKIASNFKDA